MNCIGSIIAEAPSGNFLEFNNEQSKPQWRYNQTKTLNGINIGFRTKDEEANQGGAVGMVVAKEDAYYLMADRRAYYTVDQKPGICETGRLDNHGNWIKKYDKKFTKTPEGKYDIHYEFYDCIKLKF
jgi:hypothetical protein